MPPGWGPPPGGPGCCDFLFGGLCRAISSCWATLFNLNLNCEKPLSCAISCLLTASMRRRPTITNMKCHVSVTVMEAFAPYEPLDQTFAQMDLGSSLSTPKLSVWDEAASSSSRHTGWDAWPTPT
ncbi:hypothetical protein TEA_022357 [Camellia sinensis var. sinensis]|uniref:Uncharacterized protein n=1 Tax=Camellia sinensis var. sinensis TaxID=542762 RepID=A0A4S4EQ70_CAMSN|nr:hypothetical protein TEA_022357 [Camellia sinensis var. sinensis]